MSTIFWKNLLKCIPTTAPSPTSLTLQQQEHDHLLPSPTNPTAVAITPTSSILTKNFNSLYDLSSASTSKSLSTPSTYSLSSSDSDSDSDSPPDFAAIFASQRFFCSSPGRSNSIIEPPQIIPETQSPLGGVVAVKKYSPDPYTDFKHSMQEMIEARKLKDLKADWDCLHELLSCYLSLNPKHTHKFIISAFADIIIRLLPSSSSESDNTQKPEGCQRHDASRWTV